MSNSKPFQLKLEHVDIDENVEIRRGHKDVADQMEEEESWLKKWVFVWLLLVDANPDKEWYNK